MKKLLCVFLIIAMALCSVTAFADVAADIETGSALSLEELVDKARAESGTFAVAGNSSRIETAAAAFEELYGIHTEAAKLKDQEIYEKLESTALDMVMIQDGANLLDRIDAGMLLNFVPADVRDSLSESNREPALVHQFINKLFIYNNLGDNVPAIRNVWELTDPVMKGNVIFKNPTTEQVNMNFLVMLTNDYWSEKLAEAYKAWKGEDIDLGEFKNAGYKWIAGFLSNATFIKSDTTIAEEVSQEKAEGKIGLFVLSKLRDSSVLSDNLTVAQYDATANGYTIEPFAGFMYPLYLMIPAKANRPYTAMLFIDYLMSADGFNHWGKNIGAYSPNPAIAPKEGDLGFDIWNSTLVIEDPEYILDNVEVEDFIKKYCQ